MAFTHGHTSTGSGNMKKIESWWKGQMYGFLPPGNAILIKHIIIISE